MVQGWVAWIDVQIAVYLFVLIEATFPLGRVSYLDGRVLGYSAPDVGRLLVHHAQVFRPVPPILLVTSGARVNVVTVGPVVPLPARPILLQSILSQLVVVVALLRVALVGIGRRHVVLLVVL